MEFMDKEKWSEDDRNLFLMVVRALAEEALVCKRVDASFTGATVYRLAYGFVIAKRAMFDGPQKQENRVEI